MRSSIRSPRHLYFPDVGLLPFIATDGGGDSGSGEEFFGELAAAAVSGDATIDYDAFVRDDSPKSQFEATVGCRG